ncbi:MAG: serine/threonine protein kinase [Rudaea sp.]|uniref:serine/threonine-protein kinase n=1 Tax=unclassified Rudaea TaxID=2627037 RepID=UPI0010F558D4|nr:MULTISPECIES: serine/threonine-protein kinase [unclassified Rudaea]MBN8886071.1 serine/threonine protein kinase [Rudaea sp.]
MEADRYALLRSLYDAVVDIEPSSRAETLRRHGADAELASEVLALCAADDRDRTGALTTARDLALEDATAPPPAVGDVFGAWRIVEEIGHGGMGRVYRVERSDGSYEQTAALKFIKGLAGEVAVANFVRERQLLANLNHPNISRLLDGSASALGQPFLVMEFISGQPIDAYCRANQLGLNAILDLFVAACSAVSHAHRQLIVHCDLKPSNILVNAQGQPILLDFGIAQLADRYAADADAASDRASSGYTPGYASPEQRRGERLGVASDVYSLGVVLRDMLKAAHVEAEAELAAILSMATREDPAARYPSVDALCDDLARLRAHRPVRALPATTTYRFSRFMRRHWVATSIATGIVLLSALFTWRVIAESRRAQAAEQVALTERDRARQAEVEARASETAAHETSLFLTSVFEGANPDAGSGNVSIAALLDQALSRLERDLANQPATRALMSAALAKVLFVIGQHERARTLYDSAIALERTQKRPLVLAQMLIDDADMSFRYTERIALFDYVHEALRLLEQNAAPDSPARIKLSLAAAHVLGVAEHDEAAKLFEQNLSLMRKLDPDSLDLSASLGEYGWLERNRGNYEHGIALLKESAELRERIDGDRHEDYAGTLESLANTLTLARRFREAEPIFLRAQALHRREGRMDGRRGAWSLDQYATMLYESGRSREALPLYDEIFAIAARKVPKEDDSLLVWRYNFAKNAAMAGDFVRGKKVIDEAVADARRLGIPDYLQARGMRTQAYIHSMPGCAAESADALSAAESIYATRHKPDDADLNATKVEHALWLASCGHAEQARSVLDEVTPHRASLKPAPSWQLTQAQALVRLQRDGDAAALANMQDTEALATKVYEPADPRIVLAKLPRAEWLHAHDRKDEATKLAGDILAGVEGKLVPDSVLFTRIRALR